MGQQAFCLDFPKKSPFHLLGQKWSTVPKMWSTGPKVNHRPQIGHLAHTHSGKKKRIQVSFEERGTPFKRSPAHQKSVPPCSNTYTHSRAANSRHTMTFFPTRLIDGRLEGCVPIRVVRHDIGNIILPMVHLLRSAFAEYSTSILPVEHLNPVPIASDTRDLILEILLSVGNATVLVTAVERLPIQFSPEQISNDRESVDHSVRTSDDISIVISVHVQFSFSSCTNSDLMLSNARILTILMIKL